MSPAEYQTDIKSKAEVGLAQKNLSYKPTEKESDWLIFHCKIQQTTNKAASKKLLINIHRTCNINKLWDSHWE